jgi:hypothetical protein
MHPTADTLPVIYLQSLGAAGDAGRYAASLMIRELHIQSYFSLPTDLAGEMRGWPEFVSGEGYSVNLLSAATGEEVTVRYVEERHDSPYVIIRSSAAGQLLDRVAGRVVRSLIEHSDTLVVKGYP